MTDTSVELCGLKLDNPVVPASGTFGYGNEFREFYDINILGSFSFKGTTREARFGNPTPPLVSPRPPWACSTPWACRTPASTP